MCDVDQSWLSPFYWETYVTVCIGCHTDNGSSAETRANDVATAGRRRGWQLISPLAGQLAFSRALKHSCMNWCMAGQRTIWWVGKVTSVEWNDWISMTSDCSNSGIIGSDHDRVWTFTCVLLCSAVGRGLAMNLTGKQISPMGLSFGFFG
jgi:hypothetical protein